MMTSTIDDSSTMSGTQQPSGSRVTTTTTRTSKRHNNNNNNSNNNNVSFSNNNNNNDVSFHNMNTSAMDMALATLQPVQDLSRNWDVDIASCLEEYLQELIGHSTSSSLGLDGPSNPKSTNIIVGEEDSASSIVASAATTSSAVAADADAGAVQQRGNKRNDDLAVVAEVVPNFARAGLILQGSSHVYSRKVEYLHGLVYKALHEYFQQSSVGNNKNNNNNSNSNNNGIRRSGRSTDPDIAEFYDYDPNENFLLLDDVIPEELSQQKINLKEEDDDDDDDDDYKNDQDDNGTNIRAGATGRSRKSSPYDDRSMFNKSYGSNRLSYGGNNTTTFSLMEKSRLDRTSLGGGGASGGGRPSGLASAQQQRALLGILNNGTLRLDGGHCDFGEDGILLMPGTQSLKSNTTSGLDNIMTNTTNMMDVDSMMGGPDDDNVGGRRSLFGDGEGNNDVDGNNNNAVPDFGGGGDDDDDGPGYVMNDDDYNGNINEHDKKDQHDPATLQQKRVAFADDDPTEHGPTSREEQQGKKKMKNNDLWALMDPHSVPDASYVPKPLRKGKTYRLPKGVTRPPSDCVTGARTSRVSHPQRQSRSFPTARPVSVAVETFRVALGRQLSLNTTTSTSNSRVHQHPCYNYMSGGLIFGDEFLYVAKENIRRKRRSIVAAAAATQQKTTRALGWKQGGSVDEVVAGRNPTETDYYDDDYGDGGDGFDFGGGGDNDDDEYNDGGGGDSQRFGNAGVGTFDDAFNRPREGGGSESNMGATFEELCRAHIEAFAKGAEKFALNTKLTERVSQWQARLAPILEAEERKAAFDIHYYSEILLESSLEKLLEWNTKRKGLDIEGKIRPLPENSVPVDFGSVTLGCTQSDVCRFFLASLSLANSGNLEIMIDDDVGITTGTIHRYRFKIVSDDIKKPMETYRAPSLL